MKRPQSQHGDDIAPSGSVKSGPDSAGGGLSASGLSSVRKQMTEFDDLPPEVRAALSSSDQPSDQMIDILCNMHRSGFKVADLLKVIAASNANKS